jgi:hypothetical protein
MLFYCENPPLKAPLIIFSVTLLFLLFLENLFFYESHHFGSDLQQYWPVIGKNTDLWFFWKLDFRSYMNNKNHANRVRLKALGIEQGWIQRQGIENCPDWCKQLISILCILILLWENNRHYMKSLWSARPQQPNFPNQLSTYLFYRLAMG